MLYIKEIVIMVLLAFVIVGNLSDVIYDYREGASMAHMIIEGSLVVASFVLITILSTGIWRQSQSIRQLKAELDEEKENGEPLRPASLEAARHDMAAVLQSQFEGWELTRTEKEVAMLLLKGLSFKEIAAVRDTLEKTVRQQASSIYRKSGLNGRHAFSAWFIEDFL